MTPEQKLIISIIENKKIEISEMFNYLISKKAIAKLEEFKVSTANKLFNTSK